MVKNPLSFYIIRSQKLRKIQCISITERLVVRIWLIPQVSLRYIALLRSTFYKVFPFFSKVRSTQYSVAREQYDTSNPTFHDI